MTGEEKREGERCGHRRAAREEFWRQLDKIERPRAIEYVEQYLAETGHPHEYANYFK